MAGPRSVVRKSLVSSASARSGAAPRARIADVAREAGVSKTAVSFAFNSPARLSTKTADRIRTVADRLGYRPDPVARMLTRRRTMTLGVLTPQALPIVFANPFFGAFCEGVAEAAESHGFELRLISPREGSLAAAVRGATVDGVVAIGLSGAHPEVEQIRSAGLPMVLVDSDDLPEHGSVVVDDETGAEAAAAHLLALGHREVLVLAVGAAGNASAASGSPGTVLERRLRGYRSAFREAGLDLESDRVVTTEASLSGGRAAFRSAWSDGRRPTAVLAMSDAIAIGVFRALGELGLTVPDDVSVVGFDDIPLAADLAPALTTVHQPIRQKGLEATRALLRAIEAPGSPPERVELPTHLIIRASTTAPRRSAAATRHA